RDEEEERIERGLAEQLAELRHSLPEVRPRARAEPSPRRPQRVAVERAERERPPERQREHRTSDGGNAAQRGCDRGHTMTIADGGLRASRSDDRPWAPRR